MKKLLLSVLLLLAFSVPSFAGSWDTYFNYPWQMTSTGTSGATTAVVTIESPALMNVVVDGIIVNSDKATATLRVSSLPRGNGVYGGATLEAQVVWASAPSNVHLGLNGQDAAPIFIGDAGRAMEFVLTGTTNCAIFVQAKRGQLPVSKVARNASKGF